MKRLIIVLTIAAAACAGNIRVDLIKAHQSIGVSLATIDDSERVVCFGTTHLDLVPNPNKCTGPLAGPAKLTDAKHQQFSKLLVKAFDAQVRLGPVLQSWKGPGLPSDLVEVLGLSDQITVLAREFNPAVPGVGKIIKTALEWRAELQNIKTALGGVK